MTRKNLWDWHRHGVSTLSLRDDEFPPVGVGCLAAPLYAQAHAFRARTRCGAQPHSSGSTDTHKGVTP